MPGLQLPAVWAPMVRVSPAVRMQSEPVQRITMLLVVVVVPEVPEETRLRALEPLRALVELRV